MSKYTIRVDDEDRDNAPEKPWTAFLCIGEEVVTSEAVGIGASPREALVDMIEEADHLPDWGCDRHEALLAERDELARVIANSQFKTGAQPRLMADAILAAGWRKR